MAFNLKKVLKALLFSSSQPLSINDIQAAFTRFHEQAELPAAPEAGTPETAAVAEEGAEAIDEAPGDPELYQDVPSLVTATEIREAMDAIAAELKAASEGLLLIEGANGYRLVTHPQYAR
ncbi:MAG: SMC-Scp complex subunit ScpB, partial [Bauldia sp.]